MSHDHGHGDKPFLAHHFEDEDHQFDSGKLGIWIFLVTEVLFFSGLFCAYAVYRVMHPEIFVYASQALDTTWGAINTCVLLFSSLTAAWAVRNAQLGQQKRLIMNLSLTIACAFAFMAIKYVEYTHKFHVGLYPGRNYAPTEHAFPHHAEADVPRALPVAMLAPPAAPQQGAASPNGAQGAASPNGAQGAGQPSGDHGAGPANADHGATGGASGQEGAAPVVPGAQGSTSVPDTDDAAGGGAHAKPEGGPPIGHAEDGHSVPWDDPRVDPEVKRRLKIFFGIYFCMTGLHGIHVLLGIVVFTWLLTRAIRGHFTPTYYGPIDFSALYWHIVDLIWIYLFPLLYLIH